MLDRDGFVLIRDALPPEAVERTAAALEAIAAFSESAAIARDLGDGGLLARAAIGYEDACWRPGIDEGAAELLEEALTALGDGSPELRVRLLPHWGDALLSGAGRRLFRRVLDGLLDDPVRP